MSQGFLLFRRCLMARVWAVRDLTTTFADVTASLGQPCGFSVSQFPPLKRWSWKRSGCWSPGLNSGIWDFAVVLLCPCISQGFPEKFPWKVMFVYTCVYTSVQFSRSVVSDSLRPHGLQHTRPPCPSPTPRVYSDSCPSSRWCHPTISSSVIPFSSLLQSFPASGSFPMSQLFASGGQSIGVSASTSVLPMNIQDWSPLGWSGWISLQSKVLSRVFSNTTVQKHQFLALSFLHSLTLTSVHEHLKNHTLD